MRAATSRSDLALWRSATLERLLRLREILDLARVKTELLEDDEDEVEEEEDVREEVDAHALAQWEMACSTS